MEKLNLKQVYRVLRTLKVSDSSFENRIQLLCDKLLSLGFHSIRYYEAVTDQFSSEPDKFILTHASYKKEPRTSVVGTRICLSDTTLATSPSGSNGIARGYADDSTERQKETWIHKLGISGTNWIDLAISSRGTQVGLLAISWTGSKDLISEEEDFALRIVRNAIGDFYTESLQSNALIGSTLGEIQDLLVSTDRENDLDLNHIADAIARILPSDTVAVFRFDWTLGEVSKSAEYQNESIAEFESLKEVYPVGSMLTGKAFWEEKYRFIPDFQQFLSTSVTSVAADSERHHNRAIGDIQSVAYCLIGTRSNRLLIRCFRGTKNNLPPYTDRDFNVLKSLSDFATIAYDTALLDHQKNSIQTASIDGLRAFSDPARLFELIRSELESMAVSTFVCVHFSDGSNSTDFVRGSDDIEDPRGVFGNTAADAWTAMRKIPFGKKSAEVLLTELKKLELDHSYNIFNQLGAKAIGLVAVSTNGMTTALLIPIRGKAGRNWLRFSERLKQDEIGHLSSIISIFGASLEAKSSHISAENADDLLANIGHELQTPITEIEQSAIEACELCHEFVDSILDNSTMTDEGYKTLATEQRPKLDAEILAVTKKAELVRHFMDIPRTMSEFFGGDSMPITFEHHAWEGLVDDSWKSAFSWAHEMSDYYEVLGRSSFGRITIKKNNSLKHMACTLCEPLVKMALTNLLKNAIKFSLPRYRGEPITIEVMAIPQKGWNILQIRNWGIGIDPSQFEEIFGKYHRIDRLDAKRDIAGRGLGLYLARAMVKAQGGQLFCDSSNFTLDDPEKKKSREGYLTTFEMRIPTSNTPGSRKVKLQ